MYSLLAVRRQHEGADRKRDAQSRVQAPIQSSFGDSTKFSPVASFLRTLHCCLHVLLSLPDASHWQSLSQNIIFLPQLKSRSEAGWRQGTQPPKTEICG